MGLRLSVSKILAGLTLSMLVAAPAFAQVNARQERQHHRIEQGVRSGTLTPREAHRLHRRERSIARQERRMRWRNGGYLSRHQRHVINKRLNRTSRAIYRKKHNWRTY
ncbi:MAG: hypothetical protein AB7O60_03820 [Variibacter sp.]